MEEKILSASKLKTFEDCSWKYWCNYVLNIPSTQNDGAARGTACHLVLEMLLNSRHKKYYDKITKENSILNCPQIVRLVRKSLRKDGRQFDTEDNLNMCSAMIDVELQYDFFGENGLIESPEQDFLLENDDPPYKVRGFIDKPVQYPDKKFIKIVDYKSSKNKFEGEEITANIQAMVYALAAKRLWPSLEDVMVEFLFLKFPKDAAMQFEPSSDQLAGFEHYLSSVYKAINNYSEKDATSNLAADKPFPAKDEGFKGKLLCGFASYPGQLKKNGDVMWACSYKFPFDYYTLVDKDGKVKGSALTEDELSPKEGCVVVKKHYEGCPAHQNTQTSDPKDDFDF